MKRAAGAGAGAPSLTARNSTSDLWLGAGLLALSFALFFGVLDHEFVLDGVAVVQRNPLLTPFEPLRIAGLDWWAGSGRPGGLYRPVALVSLAGLRALGGGGPGWINFANLALHGCVAWLHFALCLRLLGERPAARAIAWLAAWIGLAHPLNVEVLAGQVGHADLLANLFLCAAVLIAARAGTARFAFGALFAALAVLSKESGVLVVPLALLFETLRQDEVTSARPRQLRALAWSSLGVGAALFLRYAVIGSLASVDAPVYAGFSGFARLASACATFAIYSLPLLFAPWRQLAVVSHQDGAVAAGFGDGRALVGLLLVTALLLAPLFAWRRGRRAVAFGVWFFLAAWLPTSNLLFSSGAVAGSRFFYAGLIGASLALVAGLFELSARSTLLRGAAVVVLVWFGAALPLFSWREVAHWRTQRELLETEVARAPGSVYGLLDLADTIRVEQPERALQLLDAAAQAELPSIPGCAVPLEDLLETQFNARRLAAELLAAAGEAERSTEQLRAAEQLAERGRAARATLPFRIDWTRLRVATLQRLADAALQRARSLNAEAQRAELDSAEQDLDRCDTCDPGAAETVRLRSILLQRRGDPEGRARLIEAAWRARPDDPLLRILWANELRQRGRTDEALDIELEVAANAFATFDPARSLAIAREGLANADGGRAAKSRALLERLARPDPRRGVAPAIVQEALRLLRGN